MVDCYNRLEESSKYFTGVLRAIADNKSSPSFSNGKEASKAKRLTIHASQLSDLSLNLFLSFALWNRPICFK